MGTLDLADRTILVPESRELDLFARMLEAEGAATLRCPMVTILDLEDPAPVEAWLGRLVERGLDDLVLLTGEGLRRLVAAAERMGVRDATVAAIARARTVTRGPKPARALRELGLAPGLAAAVPTTAGVIEALSGEALGGRRVGVQLYPGNPNAPLIDFLAGRGAGPDPVLPYRYASDAEADAVATAIGALAEGRVDLVAFTSSPQIARLVEVAKARGLEPALAAGMARTRIAAVGPVVAGAIAAQGWTVAIAPESFHLKPLVTAIRTALRAG